jgi:hypothetical protein
MANRLTWVNGFGLEATKLRGIHCICADKLSPSKSIQQLNDLRAPIRCSRLTDIKGLALRTRARVCNIYKRTR